MLKKLLIAGAVLVVIAGIVLAVALYNLSAIANANRAHFVALAEAEIGRQISVGSLGVSLAGDISIRAKDVSMSDDPRFSAASFARFDELRLTVRFWPLLWQELRIKRVAMSRPVVTVIRDRGGNFNFDSLGRRAAPRPEGAAEKTQERDRPPSRPAEPRRRIIPPLLAMGKISDGTVRYIDRKRGLDLAIRHWDLALKPADGAGQIAVEMSAAILSEKQNSKVIAQLGPIVAGAALSELPVDGRLELAPLDVDVLRKNFPALLAALPEGLQVRGALQLKQATVKGTPKALVATADLHADPSEVEWRQAFFKPAGVPLRWRVEAQLAEELIEVRKSEIQLRDMTLSSRATIPLRRVDQVDIAFESNQFDASGWEKLFPALDPYRLSGQARLSGKVQLGRKDGALRNLDLLVHLPALGATLPQWRRTLSLTQATLRLALARDDRFAKAKRTDPLPSWLPAPPKYQFDAGEIVVAPVKSDAPTRDTERMVDVKSEGEVTLARATVGYRAQLAAGRGKLFKIDFKNFATKITFADRLLQVSELTVEALEGWLKADGEYRFAGAAPPFRVSAQLDGIDIRQFARLVLGAEPKRLRGRLNLTTRLSGQGREWSDIQPTLRGEGGAVVNRGALLNFNLAQQVLSKITGVVGLRSLVPGSVRERYPRIFNARDTEFDELSSTFRLANGTAKLKDVILSAPDFGAQGSGSVDFIGRLDFRGVLLLSRQMTRDLTRAVGEAKYLTGNDGRLALPFSAAGVMPKVEARPDLSAIARSLGGGLLQRGLEELKRRLPLPKADQTEDPKRKGIPPAAEELIRKGLDWLQRR